jgi:hypothetical protein
MMGSCPDAEIMEFQETVGNEPPCGDDAVILRKASDLAFDLIKVIELELSGIRDGNGYWCCSPNPVDGMMGDLSWLHEQRKALMDD